MLIRKNYLDLINAALESFPVVALLGPRQSGKTTLARSLAAEWQVPLALTTLILKTLPT